MLCVFISNRLSTEVQILSFTKGHKDPQDWKEKRGTSDPLETPSTCRLRQTRQLKVSLHCRRSSSLSTEAWGVETIFLWQFLSVSVCKCIYYLYKVIYDVSISAKMFDLEWPLSEINSFFTRHSYVNRLAAYIFTVMYTEKFTQSTINKIM